MLRYHAACGGPAPTGLQMLLLFAIHSRASETAFWGPYFRFCPQAYDDPLWCEKIAQIVYVIHSERISLLFNTNQFTIHDLILH